MEYISDRIGYNRTDDDLTVYIRATSSKDKKKGSAATNLAVVMVHGWINYSFPVIFSGIQPR